MVIINDDDGTQNNFFPSLVSENKVLCHPASVDSLSTSAGQEDHVSMGGFSARKVLQVIENVQRIIAIELLAACQAIEFLRPLRTTKPLEAVYQIVRREVMYVLFNFYLKKKFLKQCFLGHGIRIV